MRRKVFGCCQCLIERSASTFCIALWLSLMIFWPLLPQFAPEEYLYRESEIAQEMFVIISGSVEELSENKEVKSCLMCKWKLMYLKRRLHGTGGWEERKGYSCRQGCWRSCLLFWHATSRLVKWQQLVSYLYCHSNGICANLVSARCHKLTGAICLRLPRDRFIPLLKMFPDEEEKMAEAALETFEQARSRYAFLVFCFEFTWACCLIVGIPPVTFSRAGSHGAPSVASRSTASRSIASSGVSSRSGTIRSYDEKSLSSEGAHESQDDGDVSFFVYHSFSQRRDELPEFMFQGSDLDRVLGAGKTQRLMSVRRRRQEERIQKILAAACRGDLAELKNLLKVSLLLSFAQVLCNLEQKSELLSKYQTWKIAHSHKFETHFESLKNPLQSFVFLFQGQSGVNMSDALKRTPLHVAASEGKVSKNP